MLNCGILLPLVCLIHSVPVSLMTERTTTTRTLSLRILQTCSFGSDCPEDASCRVRRPDGPLCICNKGFVASNNLTVCEKAAFYNQTCMARCAGLFMSCEPTTRRCACNTGYVPAMDHINCGLEGKGLLGEACGDGCVFDGEQNCMDGVCFPNLRRFTCDEIQAFNNPTRQCVNKTYTLDHSSTTATTPPFASTQNEATTHMRGTSPMTVSATPGENNTDQRGGAPAMGAPHSSGMTVGLAVGISVVILLTLVTLCAVVVIRRRKTRIDGTRLNTMDKDVSDAVGGAGPLMQGGESSSFPEASGVLPDVLSHGADVKVIPGDSHCVSYQADQSSRNNDSDGLQDEKAEQSHLHSRHDHCMMYSNFKVQENKAKKLAEEKQLNEETSEDDSPYNTLTGANVKPSDEYPDTPENYNTLYSMKE